MTTNSLTEQRGFKLILWKSYFDKGYGLTNYFFKLVAVFGLTSRMIEATFIILFLYTLSCFVIGKVWFHYRIVDMEFEVGNIYNPLSRELRDDMKKRKI